MVPTVHLRKHAPMQAYNNHCNQYNYIIALYYIVSIDLEYSAFLTVHTNQRRFQCKMPLEKKVDFRQRKQEFGPLVNSEEVGMCGKRDRRKQYSLGSLMLAYSNICTIVMIYNLLRIGLLFGGLYTIAGYRHVLVPTQCHHWTHNPIYGFRISSILVI